MRFRSHTALVSLAVTNSPRLENNSEERCGMSKKLIAVAMILIGTAITIQAQARAQADVQVRSVAVTEVGGRLTARVEVFSHNDDTARNTTLRILLPVGVRFVSSST